jgi:hypothetical protein
MLLFMDYAVEPFYYERGHNFYEDGQNYALASLLYRVGPTLLGGAGFEALMTSFQRAVKEKTQEATAALVTTVRSVRWHKLPEALGPLAYESSECLAAIANPGVTTDAAFVVLLSLISRTEIMSDGPYRVEHDRSKNLLTYHTLLQRLINHDQEIEFRQTKITNMRFPLRLTDVTQVDSKDSHSVQLADVLIGAAIDASNTLAGLRDSGMDAEELFSLYGDDQFIHLIPLLDFEEQREFRRGSQAAELIDYYAEHFFEPNA